MPARILLPSLHHLQVPVTAYPVPLMQLCNDLIHCAMPQAVRWHCRQLGSAFRCPGCDAVRQNPGGGNLWQRAWPLRGEELMSFHILVSPQTPRRIAVHAEGCIDVLAGHHRYHYCWISIIRVGRGKCGDAAHRSAPYCGSL
jgi:hypothetical protein